MWPCQLAGPLKEKRSVYYVTDRPPSHWQLTVCTLVEAGKHAALPQIPELATDACSDYPGRSGSQGPLLRPDYRSDILPGDLATGLPRLRRRERLGLVPSSLFALCSLCGPTPLETIAFQTTLRIPTTLMHQMRSAMLADGQAGGGRMSRSTFPQTGATMLNLT